jgi:hypothetical protein
MVVLPRIERLCPTSEVAVSPKIVSDCLFGRQEARVVVPGPAEGRSLEPITPAFCFNSTGVMDSGQPLRGFRNDGREFLATAWTRLIGRGMKIVSQIDA